MAKKKEQPKKTSVSITFHGGPRGGETMNMSPTPPPFIRLAFPEWCNYFRRGESLDYEYDMDRAPLRHPQDFRILSEPTSP